MSQVRLVKLACTDCKRINYWTERRKKGDQIQKLELNKFCKHCRKHVLHKEVKK